MKNSITLDEFKKYYLDNNYNENMFNKNGNINPKYNSFKKTGMLAQIFEDHWDFVYEMHKEGINRNRPNAPKEIKKFIHKKTSRKNLVVCRVSTTSTCFSFIFQ